MQQVKTSDRGLQWLAKFTGCWLIIVALLNTLTTWLELALTEDAANGPWPRIAGALVSSQLLPPPILALFLSLYWQRREQRNISISNRVHSYLYAGIRYWLSFSIMVYAFAKLLQTQFTHPFYIADSTIGSLSGFDLTWYYFGYSYPFAVIIAMCQLTGALLLLFRRTALAGSLLLMPVMINILLVNLFFSITSAAFLNAILYTIGLSYILLLHRRKLFDLFAVQPPWHAVSSSHVLKNVLRLATGASAFLIIYLLANRHPAIPMAGKWKVDLLIKNKDTIDGNAWLNDADAWTTVYIENEGQLTLSANPFAFNAERSTWGRLNYDTKHLEGIKLILDRGWSEKDTLNVHLNNYTGAKMNWSWGLNDDTVFMSLSKCETRP